MKFDLSNPYKTFFFLWAAACIIILPFLSLDAGITEDEQQHMEHGQRILDWYEGKSDTAGVSPFDANGVWKADPSSEGIGSKTGINIYGGLFDSFSALVYQKITHAYLGEFESKHIMSALFGAMMLIFTGLICQRLTGNWATALLGIIIATFTPRLIGNSLSNPKDIPQATMFAFSLLQIISFLKELPDIKIRRVILLILSFSLAIAIRSGAIILIFYFVAFTVLYVWVQLLLGDIKTEKAVTVIGWTILASVLGYLCCAFFWPWDMGNPVMNPLRSLAVFKNFNSFDCYELFEGNWLHQNELPWYFVPKWLYITLPVTVTFGVILFFVQLPKFLQKGGLNLLIYGLLLFSVLFPVITIIINKSNIYNSCRHVLFVVPSIIVIATLGWAELFGQIRNNTQKVMVRLGFLCLLYEPMVFIIDNNPVQAMYFSPLIGGEKGAFKNYEMDYWGYSLRPAIEWLDHNDSIQVPGKKLRVRMYYGEQMKLSYYVAKSKNLAYALCREDSPDWDYELVMPADAKHDHDMLYHWPPANTVYQVMTEGVPLCAVVKSTIARQPDSNQPNSPNTNNGQPVDSSTYYLTLGMQIYQKGDYNQAVTIFKKSVSFNPANIVSINDVVVSYNNLKMYDEAIAYGNKGVTINPNYQLLKNNLAESVKAKAALVPNEAYYLGISYNYFVQGEYQKTVDAAKIALKYNPNNSVAWNNICCAYNALKQYQKAIVAADNGLKIDSKSELLKNNRAEAVRQLGKK